MAIEILAVSLSDESIERLANRVLELMSDKSGSVSADTRRTQRAEVSGEEADPWAEQDAENNRNVPERTIGGSRESRDASINRPTVAAGRAAQPAASRSATGGSRAASDGDVKTVKTKNGVQTWRFPADAPECDCGVPAGFVSGTSEKGRRWKAYRCAKRSGDDWRNACDYSEWA